MFLLHGTRLKKRYKKISKLIGKDKKVFELGCGTAKLFDYLENCSYIGWDLNKRFIEKNKRKGIDCERRDIFDYKNYPKSDIAVIIDVLHHVTPRDKELLRLLKKKYKKLIVLEPFSGTNSSFGILSKIGDYLFGDYDGMNRYEDRAKWKFDKESFESYFKGFNSKKIEFIGNDVLAYI